MSLYKFAKSELDSIYSKEDLKDSYNKLAYKSILELIKVFSKQGHSGFSANYCLSTFERLSRFKPLSDLSNNPEEWNDVSGFCNKRTYQSRKNPSCFSLDLKNYYDIDSKKVNKLKRFFVNNINRFRLIKLNEFEKDK